MNNTFIHVYKASAGAGKTFTLAAEFIANLINDFSGISAPHRHQLAITFTKKATTEMKERILQYLYELSHSDNADDGFFKAVRQRVRPTISDREIRQRSGIVLREIIHGYDRFHVTTIDSFFQSLLTNLAHELGLSANFKIDLNDRDVLGRGVERMLREMKVDSEVLKWVTDYIEERLDDDKAWNVTGVIKKLSEELLKEPYLIHGDKLRQLPLNNLTVSAYRKTLAQLKASEQKSLQNLAKDVNDFIEQTHGYDAISNGKRWGQGFVLRIANWEMKNPAKDSQPSATLQKWAAEPLSMKKKTQKGVDDSWYEDVSQRLAALFTRIPQALFTINSCDLSTRHLNPLRLLEEINASVEHINLDNNAFMLAHTPILFTKMVTDGEASFVFERAGTQFRHVMIDEFQDTSTLQWHNLRNLFLENIAQGNSCMLVGDVKQGIYRWRGGDWKTLSEIKSDEITTVENLESNFRSGQTIVDFNNRLFVEAAHVLDEKESEDRRDISQIYDQEEVFQAPRNAGGFVRICLAKKSDKDDADAQEFVAERDLGEQILRLKETGVPFEEMAILVRYNSESQAILQYFEEHEEFADIPLVSDEAFLLASSPAVQTIIHALRYVLNASDGIAKAYLQIHLPEGEESEEALFALLKQWQDLRYRDIPFYELVERLIQLFRLNEEAGQTPYLYSFLDAVLVFLDDNVPDLKRFLQHWDEVLYKQSIPSAVVEGVRILTIHKSKGLAFHSVFIPYCDWEVEKDRNDDILWLQPEIKPYSDLPLIPVPMTSSAENSIYAEDYRNEHLHRRIENLNLMYVAFTRARQNLVVCGSDSKATMSDVLNHAIFAGEELKEVYGEVFGGGRIVETELPCTIVEWNEPSVLECTPKKSKEGDKATDEVKAVNPLKFSRENEVLNFTSYAPKIAFRQSVNARRFQSELTEEDTPPVATSAQAPEEDGREKAEIARLRGELLHSMMEYVERAEDVERVVRKFAAEGRIPSHLDRNELALMLRKAMSHPKAATWFDGSWRLYRECNILARTPEGEFVSRRPDRVMMRDDEIVIIDFKFGAPHKDHHDQVRGYADLLQKMNYKSLRGYLWYMAKDHIEEVALEA